MATKKTAAARHRPVKEASAKKVAILAILEGEQYAGKDSPEKLELLRAEVEKTLETDSRLGKVLVPTLIYDFQETACAPQPKVTTGPPTRRPKPKPRKPRPPKPKPPEHPST